MQSTRNIILTELAQNASITQANQLFPEQILSKIANYPKKIQLGEISITCYIPDRHSAEAKALATDIARKLGGDTIKKENGLGLWENPYKELISEDVLLITAFTDTPTLVNNLDYLLDRVCHWGRVCNEEVMAVEIGNFNGSMMLLIDL
ncbi:hypothetical protein [Planktothrix agardhii]|jgi:hypothetical protein|uniref:hypothetical protein n=1 Tax=Planktothrix agardhii TaxID=1160 RepID=UPI001B9E6539|nr:hypothetical protein [Planktothrix agardhii]CAD0220715.1 conserved hypothetical protein [Planktothrix agardhii]CAD5925944.1 hypothetical protein NO365_00979 [Planktothrix agardhii]